MPQTGSARGFPALSLWRGRSVLSVQMVKGDHQSADARATVRQHSVH